MNKICGIYGIFSEDGNKVYIGQSTNILDRWRKHKLYLSKSRHHCRYLQNYFNKYSFLSFVILEITENLNDRESFHWDYFNKNGYILFNKRPDKGVLRKESHPNWNKKFSIETRTKQSKALKGREFTLDHRLALSENAKLRVGDLNPFYGKSHKNLLWKKLEKLNKLESTCFTKTVYLF